jgi:acyl transferase domain-containing protein/NAD(P)H-dependent flavin oxidoreductase YrpB (nitropropane dioxygenase family)/NAD(P)-dependent dehydrogenase (short-subunit alcohol dehydrogenase family)
MQINSALWIITPFEAPDAALAAAAARAGAFPVLHLGRDREKAAAELRALARIVKSPFGVCLPDGSLTDLSFPRQVSALILPWGTSAPQGSKARLIWQVHSAAEAEAALAAQASALILKGSEGAGLCAEESSFILFQRLIEPCRAAGAALYIQGGAGVHSAAAYLSLGAAALVMDSQVALFPECGASRELKTALGRLSGSEIRVCEGYHYYLRPGAADPGEAAKQGDILSLLGGGEQAPVLPLGQDIILAGDYADQYKRLKYLVRAVDRSARSHLKLARTRDYLGSGSEMAKLLNTGFPIAQGPMARISDVPEFLADVADGGGLPFLAMSLLTGAAAEEALRTTAAVLGDRPWGAGILGFAYPKIVEEQTRLIVQAKPHAVIIAGGRPAQAKPFEQAGIQVFLHVPATGLLEMFLKEGADSFIFEGRESGGHVGPLFSAVLWEKQINCLLRQGGGAPVNVFFAGGIHDARSAAFVRIMAAPLAARGAKIGLLMGTVYLYSDEIVKRKAITEDYRRLLIEQNETVLLRSGRGQETRSVPSAYTEFFLSEKRRMQNEGMESGEILLKLEELNLGRARVAAKGIDRSGDQLVSVDREGQLKNGLYMTGAVTALIHGSTSIAGIHQSIIAGSAALLEQIPIPEAPATPKNHVDIAIVGMSGIFPGAADVDEYWRNILFGRNNITEVPSERWSPELFYNADTKDTDHVVSKWGGFISAVDFDALEFGITPQSLASIEPVQLLSLLAAKRALEDAGYTDLSRVDLEETSVIFGAQGAGELASAYGSRAGLKQFFGELPNEVSDILPRLTEDSFPGVLSNVISGRISNRLNTGGRNYTVDAACASSLAALDIASAELTSGKSDMVVLGGADLHNGIYDFLMFSSTYALSKKGYCSTFDSGADGIALGEGVGVLILKRLEDAQREGNKIYAVIKGVGGSSDGKNLGLTAPSRHGQVKALERAYENAGVSPSEVGLVEAHGTGTIVGDRIELSALNDVFLEDGALPGRVQLGSVKTQIGHTKCAAGVAGLIKAVLCVQHGLLPPTLHLRMPNDAFTQAGPFAFRTEKTGVWNEKRRIAGVSGFGFGGTNFHAVVENYGDELPAVPLKAWPAELFVFPGKTPEEARDLMEKVKVLYAVNDKLRIRDVAYSLALRCDPAVPVQYVLLAGSRDELLARINAALAGVVDENIYALKPLKGKVAFLFPGQGSQRVNMAADLCVLFPAMRRLLAAHPAYEQILFPNAVFTDAERKAQRDAITDTRSAQPLLGMIDLAVAELLRDFGVTADMAAGHSYGEIPALCYAGAFDDPALVDLSRKRAEAMLAAAGKDPGKMAAVRTDPETLSSFFTVEEQTVWAVNFNSPKQTVVAGTSSGMDAFLHKLDEAQIAYDRLKVAAAFHSPLLAGAQDLFAAALKKVEFRKAALPVWSNTSAALYPETVAGIRARLAEHLVKPVLFSAEVEAMYEAGARIFIETGPGGVLTGLVNAILKDREIEAIQTERSGEEGLTCLLRGLAKYIATGRTINMEKLFEGRTAETLHIDEPERYKKNGTVWNISGYRSVPENGELPAHAGRTVSGPIMPLDHFRQHHYTGANAESVMMAYLDNMNAMIQDQRDVMLGYLGQPEMIPRAAAARRQFAYTVDGASALPEAAEAAEMETESVGAELPALTSLNTEQIADIILQTVSDKTGYPIDMLGLDMDLEADLSIDSIKKMEIIGGINERIILPDSSDDMEEFFEKIISIKTFRQLITYLEETAKAAAEGNTGGGESAFTGARAVDGLAHGADKENPPREYTDIVRMVLWEKPLPIEAAEPESLKDKVFALAGGGALAEAASGALGKQGAQVRIVAAGDDLSGCDGLVIINAESSPNHFSIFDCFTLLKTADMQKLHWLYVFDDIPGALSRPDAAADFALLEGFPGFCKTLKHEYPAKAICAVTCYDPLDPAAFPALLIDELCSARPFPEIFYRGTERFYLAPRIEPADHGDRNGHSLRLADDAAVIVLGGAQGITPHLAARMAAVWPCNYILAGRSEAGPQDKAYENFTTMEEARKYLIEKEGMTRPKEVEAKAKKIIKINQIAASMALIEQAGGKVSYHALDVRDPEALRAFVRDTRQKFGKVEGLIHAAGILEDKLFRDKELESFRRVYDTKANPLSVILEELPELKFLALFSSMSAAFGNAGQCDYAAGNSALDTAARILHQRRPELRTIAFDWGPWKGAGMVNAGLENEFRKKGISFLHLDKGGAFFVDELTLGSDANVLAIAGDEKELEGFIKETLG